MQLLSVNVGKERVIQNAQKSGTTGIYKMPAEGPVRVTALGLENDVIIDVKNHGGVDQALYVYGGADYQWWSETLGQEVLPGTFGDNLTISDLESARCSIGDRFYVGTTILEVTSPRIPCSTLSARMNDPQFVKRFRFAGRPGLYCRVIQEGHVQAGDAVRYEPYQGETVTALEMFNDFYEPDLSEANLRRYLKAPIHVRAREEKEEQLQKLTKQGQ